MARWIKVDVATPDKWPLTLAMETCGISRGEAFLAFFRVFAWLDELTDDGFVRRMRPERVDEVAWKAGFAAALQDAGWLTFDENGLTVTNWGEHNGQCAKRRAMEAKRLAALRDEQRKAGLPVRPCPRKPQ